MAESKGFFGVLPYAFASLRSLTTDFQTVHRTVFIGEADRPCSNSLLSYQQKIKGTANAIPFIFWRRARDSAHFVRRKVCYANYPDYRLLLTRLRLAKDCKGSNPINNSQKNKRYSKCYTLYFLAESKGFEPSKPFWRFTRFPIVLLRPARTTLRVTCDIIYDCLKKIKCELQ